MEYVCGHYCNTFARNCSTWYHELNMSGTDWLLIPSLISFLCYVPAYHGWKHLTSNLHSDALLLIRLLYLSVGPWCSYISSTHHLQELNINSSVRKILQTPLQVLDVFRDLKLYISTLTNSPLFITSRRPLCTSSPALHHSSRFIHYPMSTVV